MFNKITFECNEQNNLPRDHTVPFTNADAPREFSDCGNAAALEWAARVELADAYRVIAKLGAADFG